MLKLSYVSVSEEQGWRGKVSCITEELYLETLRLVTRDEETGAVDWS